MVSPPPPPHHHHPGSHGNASNFSIEILRRKRKKKRKESPLPVNPVFTTVSSTVMFLV
jgi:hypothetical protein